MVADALSCITAEINTNVADTTRTEYTIQKTEKLINEFNPKIIFQKDSKQQLSTKTHFNKKLRRTISESIFEKNKLVQILAKLLKSNKTYTILAPDDIFKTIEETFLEYFILTKMYKVIRCTNSGKRIPHRGIDETVAHLKRKNRKK